MIFQFANRYIDANQKVPWRLRIHLCWIPNAWICTSSLQSVQMCIFTPRPGVPLEVYHVTNSLGFI